MNKLMMQLVYCKGFRQKNLGELENVSRLYLL